MSFIYKCNVHIASALQVRCSLNVWCVFARYHQNKIPENLSRIHFLFLDAPYMYIVSNVFIIIEMMTVITHITIPWIQCVYIYL